MQSNYLNLSRLVVSEWMKENSLHFDENGKVLGTVSKDEIADLKFRIARMLDAVFMETTIAQTMRSFEEKNGL